MIYRYRYLAPLTSPDLPICPWCIGKPSFREEQYAGAGASGMEAPNLSIGCATCSYWFPAVRTENWIQGKGYVDERKKAEKTLIEIWSRRPAT